jgi:hypothetical protein
MSANKRKQQEESDPDEITIPKRIRGGGGDDDDDDNEFGKCELYDEELIDMELIPEEPDFIPDDVEAFDEMDSVIGECREKWLRPQLESKLANDQDLNVQWLDIDMITGRPLKKNPNKNKLLPGNTGGQDVPIIRVYGVNEGGHSVTIFIHGFTPYAYFALPQQFRPELFTEALASKIRKQLDDRLKTEARRAQLTQYVLAVQHMQEHRSIMGYETPHTQFLKVYLAMPALVPTLKRIMETGVDLGIPGYTGEVPLPPFECNVPFVLRYMIDHDISGAGWLSVPKETYSVRSSSEKQTHCQVSPISRHEIVVPFDILMN